MQENAVPDLCIDEVISWRGEGGINTKGGGEDKIEDGEQFILFPVQNPPTCLLIPSRGIKIRSSPIKRINPVKDKIYVEDGMGGGVAGRLGGMELE